MGAIVCPILQMKMVTAVRYTKSRVVPDSSLKWKNKCASGQRSLEKEAEPWELCPHPSPPAPITHLANWTLGARGHQENETWALRTWWDKEPKLPRARLWTSVPVLTYLVSCERRKRQVSHTEGMLPALGWASSHPIGLQEGVLPCASWVYFAWSFLGDKSSATYLQWQSQVLKNEVHSFTNSKDTLKHAFKNSETKKRKRTV